MNQKEKSQLTKTAAQKEAFLIKKLTEYKSVIVAYSGGVDSTYLADCANDVLVYKTKSVNVQIYWVGSTEMAFSVQKRIIGVDARYIGSHTASQSGYLSICLNKWPLKSAKQNKRKQG